MDLEARDETGSLDPILSIPSSTDRAYGLLTKPPYPLAGVWHYLPVEPGKRSTGHPFYNSSSPSVCHFPCSRSSGIVPVSHSAARTHPSYGPDTYIDRPAPHAKEPSKRSEVVPASQVPSTSSALCGTRHTARPNPIIIARCGLPCPCIYFTPFTVLVAGLEQRLSILVT